jgi:hypothetical protein
MRHYSLKQLVRLFQAKRTENCKIKSDLSENKIFYIFKFYLIEVYYYY